MRSKPRHLNPQFAHTRGRSRAFSEYLSQQTPERQRELVAAERGYLQAVDNPTGSRVAAATAYAESLRGPTYQFPVSQLLDPAPAM